MLKMASTLKANKDNTIISPNFLPLRPQKPKYD